MNKPEPLQEMGDFERELQRMLRPVAPPAGFADRVFALAAAQPVPVQVLAWPAPRRWYPLAAVLLIGLLTLVTGYRIERERRAERQFDEAIQITDRALDHTREQLNQAGIRLEP